MPLRRRLVLLAAGTVGATVLAASVLCYIAMRAELRGQVDDLLLEQAAVVLRLAESPPGLAPGAPLRAPAPPGEGAPLIQLLGPGGDVLRSTDGPVRVPVAGPDLAVLRGDVERRLDDRETGGVHLRVLTVSVPGQERAVQLARSLEGADATLARLRVVLLVLCVAGTAFAVVVSRLFARRVVAPVAELTDAAEHISATDDLGRRLDRTGDDEVGRMAARFNAMLDRLQASRAALADSVAAQRQLVADASHELRTPITSLRTNVEVLLAGGELAPGDRRRLLDDVRAQSEELSDLITDVIELARGEAAPEHREDVDLAAVVAEAVERARRNAPDVRYVADLEPAILRGAPDRLARAVANLLDNAARHGGPGGEVEVVLRGGELTVRDHGPGVPEADRPFVFDRFHRGAAARGRPGSGLGLAIVRQAVEQHGGTVAVEDAPGGGALFRVRLPAVASPAAPRSASAPVPR